LTGFTFEVSLEGLKLLQVPCVYRFHHSGLMRRHSTAGRLSLFSSCLSTEAALPSNDAAAAEVEDDL
jgi:hypothetical protein